MKKGLLIVPLLWLLAVSAAGEEPALCRLLKVRQSSGPEHTRVVLDLDGPAAYEIQSSAHSPILTIRFPKLALPEGARDVSIEDGVVHKVKLLPGGKDWARVTFFLVRPARWKVFSLDEPNRLVVDVFKPTADAREEAEKRPSPGAQEQKDIPGRIEEPPRKMAEPPPKIAGSPQEKEELPRALKAEEPREKGAAPAGALAKVLDIRHWSAPDHTRVVVDLDHSPDYGILPSTDPLICTLNLRGVLLPKGGREIPVEDPVIQKMRLEPAGRGEARLTLFLVKPGVLNVFPLKPYLDKPDRLVLDVSRPDLEEKEKEERQVTRELKAEKKRIIVLDPGHGGEDPGAIGPRGTLEKDIVLALAQGLQKALDATGEVRAFLTRRGDYFVSLHDRVKIAREYGADLFISIHANGSRNRQTRGTSIYCLSLKGASDTATQLLAQKENASDMMGGISVASSRKDLDSILLDLEQTHSINESLHLGGIALSELGRVNLIQFSQPRQAGFAVLKAPEFPAILVETAYITHPVEEMSLRKKTFQDRLCQAISAAVQKFIPLLAVKEQRPASDRG